MKLPMIASRIVETPLMVTSAKLEEIMAAVGGRIGLFQDEPDDESDDKPKASYLSGERQERKPYLVTTDGIAVIEVSGTLVNRCSGMAAWSGMTSYEQLSGEFLDAATDPAVKAIVLRCDSPGGECSGVFDLADAIYSQRGSKPIVAMVDDAACSAAYLIASQADRVIVTQTAAVGSIGVIAKHVCVAKADAMAGVKYTTIFAGARKNDLNIHEDQGDEAFAGLRAEIDRLMTKFVACVERGRGIPAEAVRSMEAALFFGETAVTARLADEIGTLRSAMEGVRGRIGLGPKTTATSMQSTAAIKEVVMAEIPDPVDDVIEDGPEEEAPDEGKKCEVKKMETPITAPAALGAKAVLQMVQLAGLGIEAADELIDKGYTAEQVTAKLLALKAESAPVVRSSIPVSTPAPSKALDTAAARFMDSAMTRVLGGDRRGLNPATLGAYARAQAETMAIKADPALYEQYLAANPQQTGGR